MVLALKSADRPFEFHFDAESIGGDLVPTSVRIFAPSGKLIKEIDTPRNGPAMTETLPADGETGLYRIEFRCYEAAIKMPVTDLEGEIVLWPKNEVVRAKWFVGELLLAEANEPDRIADRLGQREDAGELQKSPTPTANRWLRAACSKARNQTERRVNLDPAKNPYRQRIGGGRAGRTLPGAEPAC